MKRLLILLLVPTVSLSACAINEEKETAKESASSSFQPKPLDDDWSKWLVGEWEGSAESDVGAAKIWTKIDFDINGQFLIMKSESEITEITDEQRQYIKSSTFKDLQIHTIDPKTGERIGYLFDSLRCVARGTGRLEGNKEIMEWEWSATAQGATSVRIIEKINDNKFTYNHKYILPNGKKMEDKIEMTRVK
ncbi:MAG: hypothetical protein ACYS80_26160 [Planctomycetota bacterium]|jgi:hypothetical protein